MKRECLCMILIHRVREQMDTEVVAETRGGEGSSMKEDRELRALLRLLDQPESRIVS